MSTKMWIELFGYLGSTLVVVSMLMTSVVRLRVINLIGSVIFAIYALIIRSYPTAAMNFFLVGINVYHLLRLRREERNYDLIRTDTQDAFFRYLLQSNLEDIRVWFPDFTPGECGADSVYLVCCERIPAGLFIGRSRGGGETEVLLDYATPVYRDTSVGRFLHDRLAREGFKTLVYSGNAPKHVEYMEKMGYRKRDGNEYVLNL